MDARIWHNYCTASPPSEPPQLSVKQLQRLSDAGRAVHVEGLRLWLRHLYVQTPELAGIVEEMTAAVRINAESPPGAKDILAVTGANTVGKSTLMKRWAKQRYLEWTELSELDVRGRPVWRPSHDAEADVCPVVWINLHSSARIKEFDSQILEFFGLPSEGVIRNLSNRVVRAAERHHVRVLIVDDAHLLKTDWKGGRDVLDHVKHINTELGEIGATLILVGADLESSGLVADPQIAGRLKKLVFPRYEIDELDEQRTWQRIIRGIEEKLLPHLPAGEQGMLFTELAGELWHRTQGFLGDLTRLACEATIAAVADQSYAIRLQHLDAVLLSERAEERRARGTRAVSKRATQ